MLIHQLFESQVKQTPDATAVVSERGSLTYTELNAKANQVARYLAWMGVGPGARVGLCCERTLDMVVGLYAILKAGAAYVPMDAEYPTERLQHMAEAAGLEFVLTQANLMDRLVSLGKVQLVLLDGPQVAFAGLSNENLDVAVTGDNLIYIIFTSGTTGRPKGAGVYHRGFLNLIDWFATDFRFSAEDRVLLVSSLSFDLTQKNLFTPLVTGGTLCLLAPGPYEVGRLKKTIQDWKITSINCTPSAFYPLIDDCTEHTQVNSLRLAVLGGEPISLPRLRGWLTDPSCKAEVANTYGPTECTDICVFYRLNRENFDQFGFVPLGWTVPNVQLVVVNDAMDECGIGEPGELMVGGAGVGAGYINDAELTGRKFVPNTFSKIQGSLIYHTGDQVRWLSDGLLEFMGRKDYQVKIRGFRIELPEIEGVLNQHPSMREAVVVVKDATEPGGNAQLRCFFTVKQGQTATVQDLRVFVGARLPEYMIPATFQQLQSFPLSPNGKVDRGALKALKAEEPALAASGITSNDLQNKILTIWTSVLGSQGVGLDDNFFDLGGDSLGLAQVHARLQKLMGREFPITELFAHTTVRGLAGHLAGADDARDHANAVLSRAQMQRRALSVGRNPRK